MDNGVRCHPVDSFGATIFGRKTISSICQTPFCAWMINRCFQFDHSYIIETFPRRRANTSFHSTPHNTRAHDEFSEMASSWWPWTWSEQHFFSVDSEIELLLHVVIVRGATRECPAHTSWWSQLVSFGPFLRIKPSRYTSAACKTI